MERMTRTKPMTLKALLILGLLASLAIGSTPANAQPADAQPTVDVDVEPTTLSRLIAAGQVEDREPLDTEGPFVADGDRLYIFMEFRNPSRTEQVFSLDWHFVDRDRHSTQTIEVGASSRWRTWVYRRLSHRTVGNWHVEVRAEDGTVLGGVDFEVTAPVESDDATVSVQATEQVE